MAFHRTVRTMKPSHVGRMGGVGQDSCYLFFLEKENCIPREMLCLFYLMLKVLFIY